MSISGITVTANNGVNRITNGQQVTGTAVVVGECLVLDSSGSRLETGTSSGSITIQDSAIIIDADVAPNTNDDDAALNYGGRTVTTTTFQIEDSQIIVGPFTGRVNIQVTDLRRVNVIEQDGTGQMFVYTAAGGDIVEVVFRGINVWEIFSAGNFVDILIDGTNYGYLNWEAGRLDFFGFAVANIGRGHIWIGTGASDNASWHWNNDSSFNNQLLYLTAANNRYYEGWTAAWRFTDQISLAAVEDVVVVFRDDFTGSNAIRGTFVTNSNGRLAGTYDSQNRATGSNIERPILFMVTAKIDTLDTGSPGSYDYPTSVITGDQGDRSYNYQIDVVQPAIEVRSYGHLSPSGFGPSDTFTPTAQIGKRASDGSVAEYQNFLLQPDSGITGSKSEADALTAIPTMNNFFDRTKAEWVDNNDYPLPVRDGVKINPGAANLVLDGQTATPWAYTSGSDTITIGTEASGFITRVGSTEAVSSGEDDEITIDFPAGVQEDDVAYIAVGHAQSEENAWNTPSGWVIPSGLTEVQTGGSPASTPGVSVFRRVLTGGEGSSVTITNVGSNTSGIVAQMIVYRGVDPTNPEDVAPTTASGSSGDANPASITTSNDGCRILTFGFQDYGDQALTSPPSGYTLLQETATTDGAGSGE